MPTEKRSSLREQLEQLLQEPLPVAEERARNTFDRIVGAKREDLVLFGTGTVGRRVLDRLRKDGIEPRAFADNNSARWGQTIDGLGVLSAEEAASRYGQEATFVVTIYNHWHAFPQTRHQLETLGCRKVTSVLPLWWKYHEAFLPHFRDDLPHKVLSQGEAIREAFGLWSDEASRKEFVAQVRWRLLADFDALSEPSFDDQYFPKDLFPPSANEFFVDVGAYDGDTIRAFLDRRQSDFDRIVALEPDPANFAMLQTYLETLPSNLALKVEAHQLAAGKSNGRIRFDATGSEAATQSDHGNMEVDCVRLDDLLAGREPTYLKFDVEGAELDAIQGAEAILSRCRPHLAACVYHVQNHLWQIPLQISNFMPESSLFLRPHMYECWETVCYALSGRRNPVL